MKIIGITIALLSGVAFSAPQKACMKVEGMTCAACSTTVKVAVKKLDGIAEIKVDVDQKEASVSFDDKKTDIKAILAKINDTGYKAAEKQCLNKEKKS